MRARAQNQFVMASSQCVTWQCPICSSTSLTLKLYVSHLRLVHSKDPAVNIMCGVEGCREVFRAFSAFSSHVYRHHRAAIGVNPSTVDEDSNSSATDMGDIEFGAGASSEPSGAIDISECNGNTDPMTVAVRRTSESQMKTAAKFLLSLREGRQISQVAISDVVCGCKELCQLTSEAIKEDVQEHLARVGINIEHIPGLTDVFKVDRNPFHSVDTNIFLKSFVLSILAV